MSRIEWMAVAWGGLVAGIGLVVMADDPGRIMLAVAAVIVGLAGYLAGVRAEGRRVLHAIGGALAGPVFYVAFVLATWLVDRFGGPEHAGFVAGGRDGWMWHAGMLLVAALLGGLVAAARLRPQGDRRTRRRLGEG